ncbi:MAG: protein phosphatase 2C domain-containing protein [Methanomicrobiales archaeon]|nr:protein phosphatase 2C domain-containing protein [Methanomicrobiales archaeon]
MTIRHCARSDPGIRTKNEDACGVWTYQAGDELLHLFVVADGLGGHAAGEIASRLTIEKIAAKVGSLIRGVTDGASEARFLLTEGIIAANEAVIQRGFKDPSCSEMGSTVVAALCDRDGYGAVACMGDSRAYLLDQEISQITRDHSYVQELLDTGMIAQAQVHRHPCKNIVTRIIGRSGEVPDIYPLTIGDARLLLCSDGLNDGLEDKEILSLARGLPLEEACEALIRGSKVKSRDNVTIILVEFYQA